MLGVIGVDSYLMYKGSRNWHSGEVLSQKKYIEYLAFELIHNYLDSRGISCTQSNLGNDPPVDHIDSPTLVRTKAKRNGKETHKAARRNCVLCKKNRVSTVCSRCPEVFSCGLATNNTACFQAHVEMYHPLK